MLISPAEIPQISGDLEIVASSGDALRLAGGDFALTGADVHAAWQGLAAVYQAPEAPALLAATEPVRAGAADVGADLGAVGLALLGYADEVRLIKAQLERLRADATTFVASAAADSDWREDGAKVDVHAGLLSGVNAAVAAWMEAQRRCANTINARCGGLQYVADNGDGVREVHEFGYTADQLSMAAEADGGLPWGRPEERDKPWWQDTAGAVGSFSKGVVVDGVWGTVQGVGTLVGADGAEEAKASWAGLGKLALAASPALLVANSLTDLPGLERGELGENLVDTGKGLLAWDTWEDDPARAAGAVSFNIIGAKGAGAAGRAAASRAPKVADVADSLRARIPTLAGDTGAIRIPGLRDDTQIGALGRAFRPGVHDPDGHLLAKERVTADLLASEGYDVTPRIPDHTVQRHTNPDVIIRHSPSDPGLITEIKQLDNASSTAVKRNLFDASDQLADSGGAAVIDGRAAGLTQDTAVRALKRALGQVRTHGQALPARSRIILADGSSVYYPEGSWNGVDR